MYVLRCFQDIACNRDRVVYIRSLYSKNQPIKNDQRTSFSIFSDPKNTSLLCVLCQINQQVSRIIYFLIVDAAKIVLTAEGHCLCDALVTVIHSKRCTIATSV